MSGCDDILRTLVKDLGKGSVEAFDRIYRLFYRKVQRVAAAISGSDTAGKDISQSVFLKLWEKRTLVAANVRDLDSYLFRMTKNEALNYLGRLFVRHDVISADMPLVSVDDTGRNLDVEEMRKMIENVLKTMPPQRKKAFLLSREKGLSYREIAEEMGLAPKTVENHIAQSLKDFKKNLS